MLDETLLAAQLGRCLDEVDLRDVFPTAVRYAGKVRDNFSLDGKRVIVVSDRISAFDVVLGTIPFKGQVLNQLAAWWFRESAAIAPSHFVAAPDPNVTVARECTPLPVELVMRGYLTGVTSTSIWQHYAAGERVYCGHRLPEGLTKNQPLAEPLLTPTTKAEKGGHDAPVSRAEILERGLVSEETFAAAEKMSLDLFRFGQARARERGLLLVDTKYEMGIDRDGTLCLIDEIHTPDSSRYWYAADYEERMHKGEDPRALDKEYVRRWYANQGYRGETMPPPPLDDVVRAEAARRYVEAYETITGRAFVPNTDEPQARIRRNLSQLGGWP